jgi:hypothetical protein
MGDLRAAAQQEPVAWMSPASESMIGKTDENGSAYHIITTSKKTANNAVPLYAHPPRREAEQEQEADYPEEKLQAVAEYISDKYHVWYGVNARDVEEVLRQSARCGLVSNPPRREWQSLTEGEMHGLYRRAGLEAYYPRDGVVQYEYERRLDAYARAVEAALRSKNHD